MHRLLEVGNSVWYQQGHNNKKSKKYLRNRLLNLCKCSFSHSGVAPRSCGPWLSRATVISPRWIGAGEDGRVFRSGRFCHKVVIDKSHTTHTHTLIFVCLSVVQSVPDCSRRPCHCGAAKRCSLGECNACWDTGHEEVTGCVSACVYF